MKPRLIFFLFLFISTTLNFNTYGKEPNNIWDSWEKVTELPFSMRDGVGVVHFRGEIWMLGGWVYGPLTNEIYKSPDGINWTKVSDGTWQGRHSAGIVVFQDKIWVISGDGYPDVWSSDNGIDWVMEVDQAPWGQRYAPYVTVFDDKIWLMGGISFWNEGGAYSPYFPRAFNDIWSSEDGVNWKQELNKAPWGPRGIIHGSLIHNDEMWILGGGNKNGNTPTGIYNDVWKTRNGVDWELVSGNSPWDPRIHFTTISFNNKIWVIDGTTSTEVLTNTVWYSEDGKEWASLNSLTNFPPTHASTAFVYDNSLFISAGFDIDAIYRYKPPIEQSFIGNTDITISLDDSLIELTLELSSGLNPDLQIQDTAIAEIIDGKVKAKTVGNTKIAISHPGTYGFYPLTPVYVNLFVKQRQFIVAEVQPEAIVQDTILINVVTASGLPVNVVPHESFSIIDKNIIVPLTPGTLTIELQQDGDEEYASWAQKLEITVLESDNERRIKENQYLVKEISSIKTVFGAAPIKLDLSTNSGLPLSFTVLDNKVAEVTTDNSILIKGSGSTKILVSNEGNSTYFPLYTSMIELIVGKNEQKLINEKKSITTVYGNDKINLSLTTTSGLPVQYSVQDTSIAEIRNTDELIIKKAGNTNIVISNNGDSNHIPLIPVYIELIVQKRDPAIYAEVKSVVMVQDTVRIAIKSNSFLPVKIKPSTNITIINDSTFIPNNPGAASITLVHDGNSNFNYWDKTIDIYVHQNDRLLLYPNPTKDLVHVYAGTTSNNLGSIEKIFVYSIDGVLIDTIIIPNAARSKTIDVNKLSAGTYILNVLTDSRQMHKLKFVKL